MIGIRGIKLVSVTAKDAGEDGKITGSYELMSTKDKVLAKQGFNGYSDVKVDWSADTLKAREVFLDALKGDVESVLGLAEEG